MSNGVKMIMIAYNSAIENEVVDVLKKCDIKNFTKWTQVQGKGEASGAHFATEIWPGENSVIFVAVENEKTKMLLLHIKELRSILGKEGVKAFVWPLEEIS